MFAASPPPAGPPDFAEADRRPAAVLYTLVSPQLLLSADEPAPSPEREVVFGDRRLLLSAAGGDLRVRRLISTDPADYLDPRWQPGAAWPDMLI